MMRIPTLAAIDAAELRFSQSTRHVGESVYRTRSAARAAFTRPSTLALLAIASGLSAFWVVRKLRPAATMSRWGRILPLRPAQPRTRCPLPD